MSQDHLVNTALLALARDRMSNLQKQAFVPGEGMQGDPAAGGAPPPGGDPSMGGGAPMGGDPSMGGGAPPPSGGGGGGLDVGTVQQMIQAAMAQGGGGMGAGAGAASGAAIKPKIDVNVELMLIKNMLAKICDAQGIAIPAQDMTATPDKLMAMSQGQSTSSGAQVGGGAGAIPPVGGMQGMQPAAGTPPGGEKMGSYRNNGVRFAATSTAMEAIGSRAAAINRARQMRRS